MRGSFLCGPYKRMNPILVCILGSPIAGIDHNRHIMNNVSSVTVT